MSFSLKQVSFPPDWMDREAEKIVRHLQKEGFKAYLVGGCVRDTLAGFKPKDFDIVTSARPGQIRRRISSSYVIGRRFRLVLVRKGEKQFEVSTFRKLLTPEQEKEVASRSSWTAIFNDSPAEDAQRRDFTLNALYYDPIRKELLDYCGGYGDIQEGYVRMIGEPSHRLSEDPIRILRALRLAHKLHFTLEEELRCHLPLYAHLFKDIPLARKREEYFKILRLPNPLSCFYEANDLGLLAHTLPYLQKLLDKESQRECFHGYMSRFSAQQWGGLGELSSNPSVGGGGAGSVVRDFGGVEASCPTLLLLAPFLLALSRTCVDSNPKKEYRIDKGSPFLDFIFKEMGVHRNEALPLFTAFKMQEILNQPSLFKSRSARYKRAFVSQPYFPLALWVASLDQILSPEELLFWQAQFVFYVH